MPLRTIIRPILHTSFELRWHGRGGQGAVTAAIIVAEAAIFDEKYAQAFPEFGAERRGAPVKAYTRVSEQQILTRSPIIAPDMVVVLDTSIDEKIYLDGLKVGGTILINSSKGKSELKEKIEREDVMIAKVDATHIAMDELGAAIVNTAMVGALIKVTPLAKLDSVSEAIRENFKPKIAEANVKAAGRAYNEVEVLN
ncbi:MAG: 2-oxoacid:acceptor oxidoreductase family protein [Nitrososphaerota archaeon]|jgi:pyruvate ferredoxin oxidoreductase gamma subunit|nr:2-oxoacid:acceptor oxidoreductase family protein [Nitrososphaerota archaeon]MDG6927073.1 2-oxoacid:acceptor oxidoreductase family protein [Nitrososphaerota archaeon]MDG6929872.1 2-oxoacid:acceptor oxidoreductase family protein [Nitrososphaerota archaeon]MDG6932360.1 2-oxoacid:acceptor oxidoreductase family protein [Nitrososphaerota archaeon]MDG6935919.1 2-oxoacid:acceptor oxidoreductase family protein [Nitrososphaerota archaeon]